MNTLDVFAPLVCVLPHTFAVPVDGHSAVVLNLELGTAVLTCETVSWVEPVVVVEVAHCVECLVSIWKREMCLCCRDKLVNC
jgi:hypothetical protein